MQRSDHFSFSPIAAGILYPFYYPLMLQNESHIRLQAISHWPYFRSVGMILPEAFVFRLPNTMKSHYHSDLNLHSQASPEVLSMEAGPGQGWAGPRAILAPAQAPPSRADGCKCAGAMWRRS